MLKTKRFFLISILALLPCLNAAWADTATQRSFTLKELYALALKSAEEITIKAEDVRIAEKDRKRARSVLVPALAAFGKYEYSDSDSDGASEPPEDISQETRAASWGLTLRQSVTLNGREFIAYKATGELIEKSEHDLEAVKKDYLFNVAAACFGVLRAEKALEIADANVRRLKTHRDAVATKLTFGDVTRTDLYRADAELSGSRSEKVEARNFLRLSRARLSRLVPLPSGFQLEDPRSSGHPTRNLPLDELKQMALTQRAEIQSAELAYEVAKKQIKVTRGALWPELSIQGTYAESDSSVDGTYDGVKSDHDQDGSRYVIEANLTFTFFDGGLRRAEINQDIYRKRQAGLAVDATIKAIHLEVEEAYLELKSWESKTGALEDQLLFSKENFNAVNQQYMQGLSDSVDIMDANTLLVSAERELSDARYALKLAEIRLERTTGVRPGMANE